MKTQNRWFEGRPEGSTYVVLNGVTVANSRNLRGIRDYARRSAVVKVETRKCIDLPACGEMRITYANGAQGFAFFRSHGIMIDFVRKRRSWRDAEMIHYSGEFGYLTKPGQISGGK